MTASDEINIVLAENTERRELIAEKEQAITEIENQIDALMLAGDLSGAGAEIERLKIARAESLALADESIEALRRALVKHGTPPTNSRH